MDHGRRCVVSWLAQALLMFLLYLALAVLMTWPLAAHLTTHLAGQGGDPLVHYWNTWWVGESLARGGDPYTTDMLFYPRGASLIYHNFAWVNIAAALPLEPLLGGIGAYNAVFLLNLALCGCAMYDLARYLVRQRPAAFVAGLVHAFWPYRLFHSSHPNLISSQWSVWFLLCLMRAVREGKRRYIVLCALFLALTAFARLQLFVLTLFLGALYLLYSLFAERGCWNRRTAGRVLLVGLLAGAVLAGPFFPLVREQFVGDYPDDVFIDEQEQKQTDLLAYVAPNIRHPLRELDGSRDVRTDVAFVGYTVLALSVYGAVRAGRQARLWLLVAVFSFVMALGPYLRLGGRLYADLPLPYHMLGWSFPVRVLRNPHRFNVLLAIPASVLAAYGVCYLARWRARLAPLLVGGLVLFEYLSAPLPLIALDYSPFYDQLAAEPGRFGLYELPMGFSGAAKFYMYQQTIHGKPIVEGHISRPERTVNAFIDSDPFTQRLRMTNEMSRDLPAVSRHLAYLAEGGIRYLILHRDPQLRAHGGYPTPERWAAWQDWLTIAPVYEDDRIAVYHTRPRYGRDFDFELDLGADFGIIRVGPFPAALAQGEVVDLDIRWGSRAAPGVDLAARLSLVDEAGVVRQSVAGPLCADWPTSAWPAGAVAIGRYTFQVDPHLPPGRYALTVELPGVGRPAILGFLDVSSIPRTFEPPPQIARPLEARFGDDLVLLGYDLVQGEDALALTLHWQALRRMDAYYKVFVHLVDPITGAIVAQDDAVPRRWAYPTTWWEAGEVVSDEIPLPLAEAPPGRCRLMVGVYDPDTGERLPIVAPGAQQAEGRLVLPEEVAR